MIQTQDESPPVEILLVEDNPGDYRLTQEALHEGKVYNNLHWARDGVEAIDFLKRRGRFTDSPRPDIILLDLNLPKKDGREVLSEIKQDPDLRAIPVVILTTSKAEEDVLRSYDLHANCYVTKPVDLEKFIVVVQSIDRFWLTVVTLPPPNEARGTVKPEEPGRSVLLIEDNPGDARLIRELLAEDPSVPFRLTHADRLSRGLEALARKDTELVLLDLSLPDSHGLDTFSKVYTHSPKVPIIVLSGNDDQTLALYAVKSGAQDYLVKGKIDGALLLKAMQYSIERKRYQEELERQANYDGLTGLPNRHLLHDRLRQAVFTQRSAKSIAVVFIDLDHFKVINDSLGHNFGDEVLRTVGERLMAAVRDGDTVARLGGDEFVLILSDQSREDVIFRTMRRLIAKVSEPMMVAERELHITCSAGISLYPQDGPDVQTLLKNADAAMYRAKSQGRNTFQFYTSEMNELANERLSMEQSLRRALDRDELMLHYQPRVNLRTGEVDGVEALVRWNHPERGLVYPDRFIPLAEETGLIVPIGEWVLETACAQGRAWRKAGFNPVISVNLSARQLWAGGLVRHVGHVITRYHMAGQLELELTESMVMHDVENVILTLQGLRSIGVGLSVDDFGTGYSSMSYLRRLPLNALKIDGSFVRDIDSGGGPDDGLLARAIISLGHSLHLKVVGEGVENEAQRRFLEEHGCDEMQGYLFSRPVAASECQKHLKPVSRTASSPPSP